jgi:hypothetical protein
VLLAGETETVFVVALPAFALHEYEDAVPEVSVVLCPLQIAVVPVIETVGVAVTFTVTVAVAGQPFVVPVTV